VHEPRDPAKLTWCQQEMDVIRHENVGVDVDRMLVAGFSKAAPEIAAVRLASKDNLPIVAALRDVNWFARNKISMRSAH